MTALLGLPAAAVGCQKRDHGQACTRTPVVLYAVGPVCSEHQVFGAEAYAWLNPLAAQERKLTAFIAGATSLADTERIATDIGLPPAASAPLPRPDRPVAAQHADAAPGEANAARLAAYPAGRIRARVLEHLVDAGPRGTTAIEAWRWYQATYSHTTERYSVAPRLSEMVADGWAVKTGATRNVRGPGYPPEEVYALSTRGRREKGLTW